MHQLLKLKKIPTYALYYIIKFLQLKHIFTIKTSFYNKRTDMFWPFVGYPPRVYISICIKHRL